MKRSYKSNFHFLQVMMKRMMKKVIRRAEKEFSRKLLNDDLNLKVHADYNINYEIVSLISFLAKTLCEIKYYQKFTKFLILKLLFQHVIREICVNVLMISDMR